MTFWDLLLWVGLYFLIYLLLVVGMILIVIKFQ